MDTARLFQSGRSQAVRLPKEYRMGDVGPYSVVAAELAFGVAKSGSACKRQAREMFSGPTHHPAV